MTQETHFDKLAFRRALGNFATGITVITATSPDGQRVGVTANSFNSVSLDPPLILWSIEKSSSSYAIFEAASHFAVNILAADQVNLSNHFAKRSNDKFAGISFKDGLGNAAILLSCAAVFQCKRHNIVDGGDHWILIGKVVSFDDNGRSPLVYHQGSYSLVMPFGRQNASENAEAELNINNSGLSDHLYFLMLQAVRSYQNNYQPKQLSTGLRTVEARILLSLKTEGPLSQHVLATQVNMPDHDLQSAFAVLLEKRFIARDGNNFVLQTAGEEMATTLWEIALHEQKKRFGNFSEEEVTTFKKVLIDLINQN